MSNVTIYIKAEGCVAISRWFSVFCEGFKDRDEVVEADEVAVLVVADFPGGVVVDVDGFWDGDGLREVDHPDGGPSLVVDEEE